MNVLIDNLKQYWMVHLLLTLYTVMLAYHAWKGHKKTQGVADYYIGGRAMGGVVVGLSFFSTYSSTNSFVGFSGQAFNWGVPWLLLVPFVVAFSMLAWIMVAPRLRRFAESMDSLTIPDFIGFRFASNKARVLSAIIIVFASFFYMTAVFKGIGNLLEAFLGIPYKPAIVIVFFIVMIYTVVGGFISVVQTDGVQAIVMIFAACLLFAGTVDSAGGLSAFWAVQEQPGGANLFSWDAGVPFPFLLGVLFAGTIKFVVEPRQLSRFYALGSRTAEKTGFWVSTGSFAVVYSLLVPIGIFARRILPDQALDNDLVVPQLITGGQVFSEGASAFLVLAMVAAAMSSLDSVLLVMASTAVRDIVGVSKKIVEQRSAIKSTRYYVAAFAFITMLIALNPPGDIVTLTAFSGALYAACFFPAIVLGLYWRKGNELAVLSSLLVGLTVLLAWNYLPFSAGIHPVFPAVLLSLLSYVIAGFSTDDGNETKVDRLFSQVQGSK